MIFFFQSHACELDVLPSEMCLSVSWMFYLLKSVCELDVYFLKGVCEWSLRQSALDT